MRFPINPRSPLSWLLALGALNAILFVAALVIIPSSLQSSQDMVASRLQSSQDVVASRLQVMELLVQTRPIRNFPDNMQDILALLHRCHDANNELIVATDVLGYGLLSRRELYVAYHSSITDMVLANDRVTWVVYGESVIEDNLLKQFRHDLVIKDEAAPFDEKSRSIGQLELERLFSRVIPLVPEFVVCVMESPQITDDDLTKIARRLARFTESPPDPTKALEMWSRRQGSHLDWGNRDTRKTYLHTFITLLKTTDSILYDEMADVFRERARTSRLYRLEDMESGVPSTLPLYCWINGDEEAVFAIPVFGKETNQEASFYTRDKALIATLREVALYHCSRAKQAH